MEGQPEPIHLPAGAPAAASIDASHAGNTNAVVADTGIGRDESHASHGPFFGTQWTGLAARPSIPSPSPGPASSLRPSAEDQTNPEPARIISDLPPGTASLPVSLPATHTQQISTQQPTTDAAATAEQRAMDRRNALRQALKRKFP
jgi:hypothetical protein